jgi:hypothetical protein
MNKSRKRYQALMPLWVSLWTKENEEKSDNTKLLECFTLNKKIMDEINLANIKDENDLYLFLHRCKTHVRHSQAILRTMIDFPEQELEAGTILMEDKD